MKLHAWQDKKDDSETIWYETPQEGVSPLMDWSLQAEIWLGVRELPRGPKSVVTLDKFPPLFKAPFQSPNINMMACRSWKCSFQETATSSLTDCPIPQRATKKPLASKNGVKKVDQTSSTAGPSVSRKLKTEGGYENDRSFSRQLQDLEFTFRKRCLRTSGLEWSVDLNWYSLEHESVPCFPRQWRINWFESKISHEEHRSTVVWASG